MKQDELVEMVVKDVEEVLDVDKVMDDMSFDDLMEDEEKLDQLCFILENRRVTLVEKYGQREIMALVGFEAGYQLCLIPKHSPRVADSLAFQTLVAFHRLGVTLEKTVVSGEVEDMMQTTVYMRKPDGSPMEMKLMLDDALLLSVLGQIPFYVTRGFLETKGRDTSEHGKNKELFLLELMTDEMLEKEMEEAIRRENYEYAGLVKQVQDARKQEAAGNLTD